MPILHFALGLRFGKVCEQKHEQNARKTLVFWIFLRFSRIFSRFHLQFGYQHVGTIMSEEKREKNPKRE